MSAVKKPGYPIGKCLKYLFTINGEDIWTMSVEFIVMSLFLTFDSFIPIVEDCNPFQPSVAFDIETSHSWLWPVMTGFYMKCNSGLKWVDQAFLILTSKRYLPTGFRFVSIDLKFTVVSLDNCFSWNDILYRRWKRNWIVAIQCIIYWIYRYRQFSWGCF